jgi:hypothetical protein
MASLSPSRLETLPSETIDQILFYLVHPRSRLPDLTETQSTYGFPEAEKKAAKDAYNLNRTAPPDMDRYAVDTTMWKTLRYPYNDLALTSRHLRRAIK